MLEQIKKLTCAGTLAACVLAMPMAANAADLGSTKDDFVEESIPVASPFYFALRGGVTFTDDTDFGALGTTIDNGYDDVGYNFSGAIGYDLGGMFMRGLRAELELGYLESDIDSHNVGGVNFSGPDAFGSTSVFYGFASLYYDFNTGSRFRPYIGGGIGAAEVSFDGHGVTGVNPALDDDDIGFAYHLSAGLNFDVAPRTTLELGYRFIGTTGAELTAVDGTESEFDVNNHAIMLGVRYRM